MHATLRSTRHPLGASMPGWNDPAHPPVFLHTGWRTGGTWLWSRFRALSEVVGYYEPLHPAMAELGDHRDEPPWRSGHPVLDRPYFDEFRPLIKCEVGGGVRRFQSSFATEAFFAASDADLPELKDYLRLLLRSAAIRGRQPVLKFCRSLGRLEWMARQYPRAVHVVMLRNPVEQFASARRQFVEFGNGFFLAMPWFLLAAQRDHKLVDAALRELGVLLPAIPPGMPPEDGLRLCEAALRVVGPEEWYRMFLAFWVATSVGIPESTDLMISYDMLALSAPYRRACEADLSLLSGLHVDLGDVRGGRDGRLLDRLGLSRARLLRCHRDAEAAFATLRGPDWCDDPRFAQAGAMLEYGAMLAMDGSATLHATRFARLARWDALTEVAASAVASERRASRAEARAEAAERHVAAIRKSRSWCVTAPLRWLGERLS